MTDTQVNGPGSGRFIDTIDRDDPEYQRQLQRPAEVKQDVQQMQDRKRVNLSLNSNSFREELEAIINSQIQSGADPSSLIALQQISDLLLPHYSRSGAPGLRGGPASGFSGFSAAPSATPICDIRGVDTTNFTKGEKALRCKLAACYRLVDIFGWSHNIYNHITARINQDTEHFLINPFGLLYNEITASSLVKIDMAGNVLDSGSTTLGVNKAGWLLHSAIHAARPDIKAIIHLHTPGAAAVSAMKCGLLPISQEAMICGGISYHDYHGIIVDADEKESLSRNLGPLNKIMFLRNHGVVACGETIEEAFHFARNVMEACETQVKLAPLGLDNLVHVDEDIQKKVQETVKEGGGGVNMKEGGGRKWKVGELEFEALMRQLDNSGYRTGYHYHQPFVRLDSREASSDVAIPPTATSFGFQDEYGSPLKSLLEKHKRAQRAEWLSTPNTYTKTEIEETGTPNPKKITKWVQQNSVEEGEVKGTGTNIKLESMNTFAPQGDNKKELREKHKEVRKNYYEDTKSAGPQSKFLEGITWEEAQRMKDGNLSGTGDNLIMVGAASKGIIQRDHQHNAVVYKTYYAANPFENMTDEDIEKYKKEVERKQRGEPEPEPEPEPMPEPVMTKIETNIDDVLNEQPEVHQQVRKPMSFRDSKPDPPLFNNKSPSPVLRITTPKMRPRKQSDDSAATGSPWISKKSPDSQTSPGSNRSVPESPYFKYDTPDFDVHVDTPQLKIRNFDGEDDNDPERGSPWVQRKGRPSAVNGESEPPRSPKKSDTLRSTDSDVMEGSPSKSPTDSSPTKQQKKKKFRMPSFSKKKKEKN